MLEMWEVKNSVLTSMFLTRAIRWINTSSDLSTLNSSWDIKVKMFKRPFDKRSVKMLI